MCIRDRFRKACPRRPGTRVPWHLASGGPWGGGKGACAGDAPVGKLGASGGGLQGDFACGSLRSPR
eukprot:13637907-Alexandrium_andersonii.AAC.1